MKGRYAYLRGEAMHDRLLYGEEEEGERVSPFLGENLPLPFAFQPLPSRPG